MAVAIRLSRHGAKKRPYYHIVVTDSRLARDSGNILETVGKYDPMQTKESGKRVTLLSDKIKAWLDKGARPSDRVYKFLADAGMVNAKPHPVQTKKNQPSEKTLLKLKDREAKLEKAKEAEQAAKEAPVASEAPVEAPAEAVVETQAEAPVETPAASAAPEVATETPVESAPETEVAPEPQATAEPAAE
ncbi:MAG: 30S ribosomal protein S16 [Alphaproteobacteria bacterium]|nr:30S ribosomal protein S16 [Alphaproteobacteria bacterium]